MGRRRFEVLRRAELLLERFSLAQYIFIGYMVQEVVNSGKIACRVY